MASRVERAIAAGLLLAACTAASTRDLCAETTRVAAGGNLQAALDAAQAGDTILLAAGSEFVGNFVLPVKEGSEYITLRTDLDPTELPGAGTRIGPVEAGRFARLRSPNNVSVLRTAAGAHHWRVQYLEFRSNRDGYGDILAIGDGSSAQDTVAEVPQYFELDHLYVHGDPLVGQKRCISINAAHVTLRDSHVSDCKGVGMDTQAVAAWNGPGPFVIENNYLEGAGENVLFGGADPAIADLIATGITFRGNYVSRPMAWRDPIIPTPAGLTAVAGTGGSLPPGTYAYRVVARRAVGQGVTGRSTASAQVTVSTTSGAVELRWDPVPDATEYKVYGRGATALDQVWTVTSPRFVDDGTNGKAEAVPTSGGTRWLVKNLFELKNARAVVVEGNVFENHWKDAQAGYAIVFTPRNSGGRCTWCTVEDVRFERNVVRNVAAGFNLLGYDSPEVSGQARRVTIRHNVVYDVKSSLGGNAWFLLLGDEPADVTVDHNTVAHEGASFIYVYGGTAADPRQITGAVITNNLAQHNRYGITGANFSYGNDIISHYFPSLVFAGNYLAQAPASRYPATLLTGSNFATLFVDAAAADFRLSPDGPLCGAAADGSDVGADVAAVMAGIGKVAIGQAVKPRPRAPTGLHEVRR